MSLHPDKTRLIEFGRLAAAGRAAARARQAGDLRLPGLHLHLRRRVAAAASWSSGRPGGTACGRSSGRSRRTCDGDGTSPSPNRGTWLAQVVRGFFAYHAVPTNYAALGGVQGPGRLALAAFAPAAQSDRRYRVDPGSEASRRLPPETEDPSSLAQRAGRRQAPEVGAGCPNWARPDLCGGHEATRVPTAIVQPDRLADHLGRKAIPGVGRLGGG